MSTEAILARLPCESAPLTRAATDLELRRENVALRHQIAFLVVKVIRLSEGVSDLRCLEPGCYRRAEGRGLCCKHRTTRMNQVRVGTESWSGLIGRGLALPGKQPLEKAG